LPFRIYCGEIFKAFGESVAAGESQPASLYVEKFGLQRRVIGLVRFRRSFGGALVAKTYSLTQIF
jgi:hypothetical protein